MGNTKKHFYKNELIVIVLFLLPLISKSQTNGLAVDMQYEQRIQDVRYQNSQMQVAYAKRYNNLKEQYTYALGLNAIKDSPKELTSNGLFDAVITNGGNILEECEVTVIDNQVVSIKSKGGNVVKIYKSTNVVNFRAIVTLSDNKNMEIIFTFLFN